MKNCVLNIEGPVGLDQIAELWGVTPERIRQLEAQAYVKYIQCFNSWFTHHFTKKEDRLIRSLLPTRLKIHPVGGSHFKKEREIERGWNE